MGDAVQGEPGQEALEREAARLLDLPQGVRLNGVLKVDGNRVFFGLGREARWAVLLMAGILALAAAGAGIAVLSEPAVGLGRALFAGVLVLLGAAVLAWGVRLFRRKANPSGHVLDLGGKALEILGDRPGEVRYRIPFEQAFVTARQVVDNDGSGGGWDWYTVSLGRVDPDSLENPTRPLRASEGLELCSTADQALAFQALDRVRARLLREGGRG